MINRQDVLEQIRDQLAEANGTPREAVREETTLVALELDSLEMAAIALEWEHDHGVQFSDERIVTIKTIGQAIDALEEAVGRVATPAG